MSALARIENLEDYEWQQSANTVNQLARAHVTPVVVARSALATPSSGNIHQSKWTRTTISRLLTLVPLQHNWDFRGSAAVRGDVINFAWQLLSRIMPPDAAAPVVVPLGHGGIQLEWNADTADLIIGITRPYETDSLLVERRDGEEVETDIAPDDLDSLTKAVRKHFRA